MNNGYIGRKMSKNAAAAHQRGQFPLSKVTSKMLKENGFNYSVEFFKWLCNKQYVVPLGYHHTGAGFNMTSFYSTSTITYIAKRYNLDLLYQLYLGKITKEELKNKLGITYVKAKVMPSVLGFKISAPMTVDLVHCGDYYYFSKEKRFVLNDNQIEVIKTWDEVPDQGWNNRETQSIVKALICKKPEYLCR